MSGNSQLNSGEFSFNREDFATIADLLKRSSGIHLPESKSALVYSRLVKRLRALGLSSFNDYCRLIGSAEGSTEFSKMCDALTTNVTRFFREPHHFEHLRTTLLPRLLHRARSGGKVRFWSAGCSTGQEPYSLALTILSEIPDARSFDIKILATDISSAVLETARAARYSVEEVEDVPRELRNKWMERRGDDYVMDDAVRSLVSVKPLNLMSNWPMKGPFDAIFCRNVVIYFEEATQVSIWKKMVPLLANDGALYIGHSERVTGLGHEVLRPAGITSYVKAVRVAA